MDSYLLANGAGGSATKKKQSQPEGGHNNDCQANSSQDSVTRRIAFTLAFGHKNPGDYGSGEQPEDDQTNADIVCPQYKGDDKR
jgi:hypothetical protein